MIFPIPPKAILSGTAAWTDGTPFDGYLHLGLVLPQNSDGQWPTVTLAGLPSPQRLPIWTVVPIVGGIYDNQTKVWQNKGMTPPGTQYVAYWYDLSRRRLFPPTGTSPTPFSINSTAFTMPTPTLTAPTSGTVPVPDDSNPGI